MALLDRLQRKEGLTANEAQLADYVLAHADEVSGLGISQLAERAYTSKAAISRFCKKLGLGGYHEFQVALASETERARQVRETVDVNQPFHEGESTADVMSDMATLSREAVSICYAALSPEKVKQAARLVAEAQNVYLYATGDSQLSTLAFANLVLKLGVRCITANQYDEGLANTYAVTSHDVALVVSYSGSVLDRMPKELEILHRRGCKVVAVTSRERPQGVDLALTFPRKENVGASVATFYSQQCIRFVLNCIYGSLYTRDYEGNARRRREYERIADRRYLNHR